MDIVATVTEQVIVNIFVKFFIFVYGKCHVDRWPIVDWIIDIKVTYRDIINATYSIEASNSGLDAPSSYLIYPRNMETTK